jgi:colicin import membrane protein
MRAASCGLLMLCLLPVSLQAADSEGSRIAGERKAMAERYAAEERACVSRFAVTACVDEVRARRREALAPLRDRELKLDEAERQHRAQDRRQAIAQRQAEAGQRAPAPPEPEARVRQPLPGASASARAPRAPDGGPARAAAAEARAQDLRQRQGEAKATQERIARQLAQRELNGKKSQALPIPPKAPTAASTPAPAMQPASVAR